MTTININEAKTHLSRYAKRVKAGETIILCDRNKPFAEIRPIQKTKPNRTRKLGQMKGCVNFAPDFFDPDKEIEEQFLGGELFPGAASKSK
jgi:antitoxin (DNA-binding transcriptional repressor) of toxin-antitoxin stability system